MTTQVGSWSGRLTLLAFVALVAGPILGFGVDRWGSLSPGGEWYRWQAARALVRNDKAIDNAEQQQSLADLENAARRLPEDLWLQKRLIQVLCVAGRADEALKRCEKMIKASSEPSGWLELKSECLAALGQFGPALESLQQFFKSQPQPIRPSRKRLNEFAYHRALASSKLDLAAREIQQAIERELTESKLLPKLTLAEKTVVATSLLSRYADDQALAIPLLDRMIEQARWQAEASDQSLAEALLVRAEANFPLGNSAEQSVQVLRLVRDADRKTLATLLATRALLLDDLERLQECDYDRATIIQLGFDEQDLLDFLPDDGGCVYILTRGMAYLDTRGFIHSLRPWSTTSNTNTERIATTNSERRQLIESGYQAALADLDVAVAAGHVFRNALGGQLAIVLALSPDELGQQQQGLSKALAAFHYHRLLAHQRAEKRQLADDDRNRIEQLGFEVGPHLY